MVLLALCLVATPPVHARIQLGDLLKKAAGKDKEQAKEPAKTKDSTQVEEGSAAATEAPKSTRERAADRNDTKVDNFIDANHDGVDDRKQVKIRRDRTRRASPAAPTPASKRTPKPKSEPDSVKHQPPR